jgi:hypothetical protein
MKSMNCMKVLYTGPFCELQENVGDPYTYINGIKFDLQSRQDSVTIS